MTKWTAPDIASIRGDNSRPLQKIFASLSEHLKDYQNGYTLDSLDDVTITTPTVGQLLSYDATNSIWVNVPQTSITSVGTLTGLTIDGPSSSSMTFGDWSTTPAFSGIQGNMGHLLLGKNALDDFNIYLRGNNSVGGVNIGANNTTVLNVNVNGINVTGTATISGSSTIGSQSDVASRFSTSGGAAGLLVGSLGGTAPFVGTGAGYPLTLNTNGVARINIDSTGNVGVGTTSLTGISFRVNKNITGAINSYASIFQGTVQADVTSQAYGVYASLGTTGTPTTAPTLTLFAATQGNLAGTVTSGTQRGYFADSNLIGATNNYAFQGAIPSGTGRYNLYMSGDANNYLAGRLGVGATLTSGAMAQVVNTTAAEKAFIVKGAVTQAGDFFDIQDSSGTSQFKVDSAVNLLLGTTSRRSVGGAFQNAVVNQIFTEQGSGGLTAFTSVLNRADSNGLRFVLGRSRGTAVGAVTALVANDSIAEFHFAGADGTTLDSLAARIMVHVDGAVAAGSVAGRLSFATNPVAGTNPVERMRITSDGNVGIGTTAPTSKLEVNGSATIDSQANVAAEFGTLGGTNNLLVGSITGNTPFVGSQGASALTFRTNNAERIRISSAGDVTIGTANNYGKLNIAGSAAIHHATPLLNFVDASNTRLGYLYHDATNLQLLNHSASGGIQLATNSVNRFNINSAGEVGIASPSTSNIRLTVTGGSTNSANPVIMLNGVTGSGSLYFHNDMSGGAYNSIVTAGAKGIIATGANSTTTKGALVIAPWSSDVYGIRFTGGSTTDILVRGTSTFTPSLAANKALIVQGVASQNGSLFEAQNSSGTALVTINSAGKVGIGNTAPENTLDITGSFGRGNPAVKTANFTLAGTENWIICNGAGTINITLPTPSDCDGREFGIKTVSPQLVQSAANNVIAIGGGAAGAAILPATAGAWAILVSDGANWNIMCRGT